VCARARVFVCVCVCVSERILSVALFVCLLRCHTVIDWLYFKHFIITEVGEGDTEIQMPSPSP